MSLLTFAVAMMVGLTISGSPQTVHGSLESWRENYLQHQTANGLAVKRRMSDDNHDQDRDLINPIAAGLRKRRETDLKENRHRRAPGASIKPKRFASLQRKYLGAHTDHSKNLVGRALSKASRDIHLKDHEIDFGEANSILNSEARGKERLAKKKVARRFQETDFNPSNNLLNRETRAGPESKNKKKGLY